MSPRLSAWLGAVASPAAEPRFHPAYEAVRAETAKLDSPAAGPPDWAAVVASSDVFLREVGKDLVVATSLAVALGHREGASGLGTGIDLVLALLRAPDTTPTRARARANALAFLVTRGESVWDSRPAERERAVLDALLSSISALDACASETLGGEAPSFRGLSERARRAKESLPSETPPPPPVAVEAPAADFAAPPPPLAPAAPIEPIAPRAESIPTQLRKHAAALLDTAAQMRAPSPLDADALRVWLVSLYLPISSPPPTARGARTALPPPPKLALDAIERLSADAPPESVVREVLGAIERNRLALDLHLHLSRALERAGEAAAEARRVHRHELLGLHARLPTLASLEFSDGTPLAGPATRELLDGLVRAPDLAQEDAESASPLRAARELARDGRFTEALGLASRARSEAPSGRARFEATLGLAAIAEEARALPLAEELHAALLRELDDGRVDAWEPELAASALAAHLRFVRARPGQEALAKTLFGRLAVVDPTAALSFANPVHATVAKTAR